MKKREIDLSEVLLSPEAVAAWHAMCKKISEVVSELHVDPTTIPDERARVNEDGTLTVYIELAMIGKFHLDVPRGMGMANFR